jgi:ribonuclease-3
MTGQPEEPVRAIPGIDHLFSRPELLREALTHRSRGADNYERLEFLGDSVLNLVVSRRLYETRPDADEGSLSRLRSRVVRGESLARMARSLGLGEQLLMGPGELRSGGYRRQSVLADALEAVLGAVYLDGGFEACERVIRELFDPVIDALPDAESLKDAKTRLQEWLQARARPLPEYRLEAEEGADHAKRFRVSCRLPDTGLEEVAEGSSRRRAEQTAAAAVLERSGEGSR